MSPGELNRRFEWNEWGPRGTRMMPAPSGHSTVWVCYVFGTKFVSPKRRMGALKAIHIYDFNQLALGRAADGGSAEVVDYETAIKGRVFQDEVTTWLPFREWTYHPPATEAAGNFDAVMLSEDSLLTVSSNPQQPASRTYRIFSL